MKKNILVVDDDVLIYNIINRVLTNSFEALDGCCVDISYASCVSDAIQILETQDIDLVFLDYMLKTDTAEPVIEYIHSMKIKPKIVMVTSIQEHFLMKKLIGMGANDIIHKPFTKCDLIQNTNKILFKTSNK